MNKVKKNEFVNFVNEQLLTLMTASFKPDLKDMFKTSDIDVHCPDLESAFLKQKIQVTFLKLFVIIWLVSKMTLLFILILM